MATLTESYPFTFDGSGSLSPFVVSDYGIAGTAEVTDTRNTLSNDLSVFKTTTETDSYQLNLRKSGDDGVANTFLENDGIQGYTAVAQGTIDSSSGQSIFSQNETNEELPSWGTLYGNYDTGNYTATSYVGGIYSSSVTQSEGGYSVSSTVTDGIGPFTNGIWWTLEYESGNITTGVYTIDTEWINNWQHRQTTETNAGGTATTSEVEYDSSYGYITATVGGAFSQSVADQSSADATDTGSAEGVDSYTGGESSSQLAWTTIDGNLTSPNYTMGGYEKGWGGAPSAYAASGQADTDQGLTEDSSANDSTSVTFTGSGNVSSGAVTRASIATDSSTSDFSSNDRGESDGDASTANDSATSTLTGNILTGGYTIAGTDGGSFTNVGSDADSLDTTSENDSGEKKRCQDPFFLTRWQERLLWGNGTTFARGPRRLCVPCAQTRQWPDALVSQRSGLPRKIKEDAARFERPVRAWRAGWQRL